MNILVLVEYFPESEQAEIRGGVESRTFHLARELAKRHNVTVVCSYQGKSQHRLDRIAGVNVIRVGFRSPYANTGNIIPRLSYAVTAFFTVLVLPKLDLIEATNYISYPVASLLGIFKRKSTIATYHESWTFGEWLKLKGWLTGSLGALWTFLSRQLPFSRIVAVSGATKNRLVSQHIPAKEISIVYNGVDVEQLRHVSVRPYPEPSVMCSARLIASKRVDLLIKAVGLLKKKFPNIKLTVHGEGDQKATLEKMVATLKLQKHVTFKGRISKFSEVLALRKRHRVFCLPSDIEGFGMVIIESLALGVPVVCTDIPVFREITKDGTGALLFHKGNSHDLAEKLGTLLTDKALYAKKQREGLAHAKQFDWKLLARQLEKVYRGALR
jgi:glycosyltransferase involved in cell wall biosynthesis